MNITVEAGKVRIAAPAGAAEVADREAGEGGALPSVADLMVRTKIVPSKSAARRAIAEGGAYLNNRKVTDVDAAPTADDLLCGRFLILRRGSEPLAR